MVSDGTGAIGYGILNAASDSQNLDDRWITQGLELLARVHHPDEAFTHRLMAGDGQLIREEESPTAVDQVIQIRAQLGKLRYDKESFAVKAGSTVTIVFRRSEEHTSELQSLMRI